LLDTFDNKAGLSCSITVNIALEITCILSNLKENNNQLHEDEILDENEILDKNKILDGNEILDENEILDNEMLDNEILNNDKEIMQQFQSIKKFSEIQ
ncbi:38622_t:CDS:1, partial [Gigaspora margarita]